MLQTHRPPYTQEHTYPISWTTFYIYRLYNYTVLTYSICISLFPNTSHWNYSMMADRYTACQEKYRYLFLVTIRTFICR